MTKYLMISILLLSAVCSYAETLKVNVTTEGPRDGVIAILVFTDKKGFPSNHEKAFFKDRYPVTTEGTIECALTNMPYGTYSLSVLHDINDNYKADKMLGFGPPKEPVGFSNISKKVRKKPRFEDTLFSFTAQSNEAAVVLRYIL